LFSQELEEQQEALNSVNAKVEALQEEMSSSELKQAVT
jgi:molybdopterin-biosynthesis enzyme MoeA-like protein